MLAYQAQTFPDRLFTRYLKQGEVTGTYSYSSTWEWAVRWATLLHERGLRKGAAVVLALPNSDDFIGAYFGTLLAGGIPAPVAPLRSSKAEDPYLASLALRMRFIEATFLVVPEPLAHVADSLMLAVVDQVSVITRKEVPSSASPIAPDAFAQDVGHLQFTSGTSGSPKAVQLTHAALLAQMEGLTAALQLDHQQDRAVSWLPLFHDMGLIGFLLTPAFIAADVSLLQQEDFMLRPSLWIKAISEFQPSIVGGPPSAYALCARHVRDSEAERFDLRSVRIALVGAEPIAPKSLDRKSVV